MCIVRDEKKEYYGCWRLTSHVCGEREGRGTQVVVFTWSGPSYLLGGQSDSAGLHSNLAGAAIENIRLDIGASDWCNVINSDSLQSKMSKSRVLCHTLCVGRSQR